MQMTIVRSNVWYWIAPLFVVLSALLFTAVGVQAAEVTDQSHKPASFQRSQQVGTINNVGHSLYQTFEVGTTGKLSAIEFFKVGQAGSAGLGRLHVQIVQLDRSGKPTETVVTGSFIRNPIANGWQRVDFASPADVNVGEKYALKFACVNCASGSFFTLGETLTSTNPTLGYSKGTLWKKRTNNVNYFNNLHNDLGFSTIIYVPSKNANLSGLELSEGELSPSFSNSQFAYYVTVGKDIDEIQVKANAEDEKAALKLNGVEIVSGEFSADLPLLVGDNEFEVEVTAEDGLTTQKFDIHVYREPVAISIISPTNEQFIADSTPSITGLSGVGAVLDVYVNNVKLGQTTADLNGEWTYEVVDSLSESVHLLSVVESAHPLNTAALDFGVDITGPEINYVIETSKTGEWYKEDVIISYTCSDSLSPVAVCPQTTTLTDSGADQSITLTATDKLGNSNSITVENIDIDKVGPQILYSISQSANSSGWFTNDVTIDFICADDLSGVAVCPASQTLSTEAFGQSVVVTATDLIGNSTELTISDIHIDKVAPIVEYLLSGDFNGDWYSSDVTAEFYCEDAVSGIEECPSLITLTESGISQQIVVTVFDQAGNSTTVTIENINIDIDGPTVTTTVAPAANSNGWYNAPVLLEYNCEDPHAGVDVCPVSQVVSTSGENQLVIAEAVDVAGNITLVETVVNIDLSAPIVNYTLTGTYSNGWYTSDVVISFQCDDDLSGVDTCPSDQTISTEGFTTGLTFTVYDFAGNETTITIIDLQIDKTAPIVSGIASATPNANGWYNGPVTFEFTCTDEQSGVVTCPLPIDFAENVQNYTETLEVFDVAGNKTEYAIEGVNVDLDAPEVIYTLIGTKNGEWYTSDVTVRFICADLLSGVVECPADVVISNEGITSGLSYMVEDLAGNVVEVNIEEFKIDKTAPIVTWAATTLPNANGWYNGSVTIEFTCSDNLSGVVSCPDAIEFTQSGIDLNAVVEIFDKAGNITELLFNGINIDMDVPVVNYTINGTKNGGWYSSDVTIRFTCIDLLSGIVECPADLIISEEGSTSGLMVIVDDQAGNSFLFEIEEIFIDKTKPIVSGTATTAPNANGWYNTPVTVAFGCSDELSDIASCTESLTLNESVENAKVIGTAIDVAGNETNTSVEGINIDLESPVVSYTVSGTKNGDWYTSDVTISFTCTDNLSGVVECPTDIVISSEGLTEGETITVMDLAGNSATIEVEDILIDKTAPIISGTTTTEPNANGWYTTPVTIEFTCSDNGSGIATCTQPITLNQSGTNVSTTGTTMDKAGNSALATIGNLNIDLANPSAITDLRKASQTNSSIMLTWSAATDNIGVTAYQIYRNSVLVATVTNGLTYTDSGIVENIPYVYSIRALDAAGNYMAGNTLTASLVASNKATVYYKAPISWNGNVFIHYSPNGGTWTVAPGTRMNTSTINGYHVVTLDLGTATGLRAAFTNGNGLWDNNATKDYMILMGTSTVENNTVKVGEPFIDTIAPAVPSNVLTTQLQATTVTLTWTASTDNVGVKSYQVLRNGTLLSTVTTNRFTDNATVASTTYVYTIRALDDANNQSALSTPLSVTTAANNTIRIFYRVASGTVSNIHYRPIGGAWTVSPGIVMQPSTYAGFNVITLNIGTATGIEAAFNNGAGVWDNNATRNYNFQLGTFQLNNRVITNGEPVIDTVAPTVPSNVTTSNVTRNAFTASWTASTDNVGVRGYNVYLNGAYIATASSPSYTFANLTANTSYNVRVLAYDAANNRSAQSTAVSVNTLAN